MIVFYPVIVCLPIDRRLSRKEVDIFTRMQLDQILFTSTSLNLTNLHLDDLFLVHMCGYIDYLITGEDPAIRKLYFNSRRKKMTEKLSKLNKLIINNFPKYT